MEIKIIGDDIYTPHLKAGICILQYSRKIPSVFDIIEVENALVDSWMTEDEYFNEYSSVTSVFRIVHLKQITK